MTSHGEKFREVRDSAQFAEIFIVSRETLDRLELYDSLIRKWQPTINLVAPRTLEAVWHRHFADSAQLIEFIPETAKTLVDLGSGGGFPGLVLAIMLAPAGKVRCRLIEADQRKAAFLREVVRQTAITVDITVSRIENPETQAMVGGADVVTARALAPMGRLLALAQPYFGSHSTGIFLKGRDTERELKEAASDWCFESSASESVTGGGGQVVVVRRLKSRTEG